MPDDQALSIAARALLFVRDAGAATIGALARGLDLSRTSVENAVAQLVDLGLLVETGVGEPRRGAGRPARNFEFRAAGGVVVGIDIGYASVRVLIADLAGRVLLQKTHPGVGEQPDAAAKLTAVIRCVRGALAEAAVPLSRVRAAGVSLPAIVDENGRVIRSVVIPEWSGIDIGARLARSLACPVSVDNGVRLAAVAEHHLGVAQLVDDVLYLSVGNRIAMGLILGGRPRRGIHNVAGDIGRLAFRGLDPATGQLLWRAAPTAAEVFELARRGDPAAHEEIAAFIDELAHGLAMLIMTIDPALVVVGGGLSLAHGRLLDPLRSALRTHTRLPYDIPVVEARLGAEAAAHGALVDAFRRSGGTIYGLDGIPAPPITPLGSAVPSRPHDSLEDLARLRAN